MFLVTPSDISTKGILDIFSLTLTSVCWNILKLFWIFWHLFISFLRQIKPGSNKRDIQQLKPGSNNSVDRFICGHLNQQAPRHTPPMNELLLLFANLQNQDWQCEFFQMNSSTIIYDKNDWLFPFTVFKNMACDQPGELLNILSKNIVLEKI